jgi:roadblock/LC7 domain-containing protein
MRTSACFVILILMSTVTLAQQLATPKFVTDPAELKSIPNLNVQKFTVEKLFMTRAIGGTAWSPDGKSIAFMSNISGRMNLWTVPAEGGWPMQLTVSEQRQFSPAWSPDGKWIAYMSDHNGDEQWDIFVVSPLSGEVINLTQTPEIAEEDPQWSPDGRLLAYMVKPKTSSTFPRTGATSARCGRVTASGLPIPRCKPKAPIPIFTWWKLPPPGARG